MMRQGAIPVIKTFMTKMRCEFFIAALVLMCRVSRIGSHLKEGANSFAL